ncbi:MAG TPA: hypothetical protein VL092_03365, partial [Chitinophagaceae bacterium]|nr:hypothetical protein [Chitinophagaceae bacterium]
MKFSRSIGLGLCIAALSLQATAQNDLSVQVAKQLSVQQAKTYPLFSLSGNRSAAIDQDIKNVTYLSLDRTQLSKLTADNEGLLSFSLPLQNGTEIGFQLMRYDFRTKDYRTVVKTASGYTTVANPDGDFYRGAISGVQQSMAAFSFYEDEIGAVFSDETKGNYNLVLNKENPGTHNENYILYREDDIVDKSKRGHCGITDDIAAIGGSTPDAGPSDKGIYETNCKTVRISVFADYLLYQRCTSSVVKSVQYMNTLFNVISALYANDRLFLNLSETIVATVSEGYTYSSSDEVLMRFGNLVQG